MTLEEMGYDLYCKAEIGGYPSITYRRVSSHGFLINWLLFDTCHGGPWTFETHSQRFVCNAELDWTTQKLKELNPAENFVGCDKGHFVSEMTILSVEEVQAIAEKITALERERTGAHG